MASFPAHHCRCRSVVVNTGPEVTVPLTAAGHLGALQHARTPEQPVQTEDLGAAVAASRRCNHAIEGGASCADDALRFLRRVLPWPASPSDAGYGNIHWVKPNPRDKGPKGFFYGKPFKSAVDAGGFVGWLLQRPATDV